MVASTRDLDVVPRPDLLNLSRLGEALAELGAGVLKAPLAIDVTDPNLLRRAPLVPLMTRYGRLDLLNIEQTAGAPAKWEDLRRPGHRGDARRSCRSARGAG